MDKIYNDLDKIVDVITANVKKNHPDWDDFKIQNEVIKYYMMSSEVMFKFKQKYGYEFIRMGE